MRKLLLASVATFGLAFAGGAFAQTSAPRLPTPPVSADSGAGAFLQEAERAVTARRTGEAEEALERAETRLLERTDVASSSDQMPAVKDVTAAREALQHGDTATARQDIEEALASANSAPPPPIAAAPAAPAPAPTAAAAASGGGSDMMADGVPGANYGDTMYVSPDHSQITYSNMTH